MRSPWCCPAVDRGATLGNSVMAPVPRTTGNMAAVQGFRSSFKDWACRHDVDELQSEFALTHVERSATVAAYARGALPEKRGRVIRRWAD